MPSVTRAPVGLSRVATATGLMLAAAVSAHAAAGGTWPPVGVLALLAALLAVVGAAVTRIGPRRRRSLLLVGAGQYAAHQLLAVTSHWSMTALHPGTGQGPGHSTAHGTAHGLTHPSGHPSDTGAALVRHPVTGEVLVADGGDLTGGDAWFDGTMAVAHLAATVAVALVLATGDRAVAAARSALRPRWWRQPVLSLPVRVRPQPVLVAPVVVPSALVCVARRPRRGPPRSGAARLLAA